MLLKKKNMEKKPFAGARATYKDRIFKHKLRVLYRVALVAAVVFGVTLFIKIQIDNRVYKEAEVMDKLKKNGTAESTYEKYNGNLLVHSKDGISAYDLTGTQMWNQTYEMQDPIVKVNGNYVAAGDYRGSTLYIMNEKGIQSEVDTNLPIQDIAISQKGVAAVVLADTDTTWIRLYSSEGEVIANNKTTMNQSGYPLAVSISPDNIKLGVSFLKSQGGQINTSVAFYNFGDVGQNKGDHLVSGFDFEETVIPYLEYVNETDAFALSDSKLLVFKGKQIPSLDVKVKIKEEVQSVYHDESHLALVYADPEGKSKYRLDLYDLAGKKIMSADFDMEYTDILLSNGNIIIYNAADVLIMNTKGLVKYRGDLGGDIQTLIPTESATKFLVIKSEDMEIMRLH